MFVFTYIIIIYTVGDTNNENSRLGTEDAYKIQCYIRIILFSCDSNLYGQQWTRLS